MKNYLALVLAVAVVSSPAHASRARLESLGEAAGGSYYIDDSRNIFLNPAQIVHYKKKLFLELGQEPGAFQDQSSVYGNTSAGNRPEGGFTNTFGDFTYGLYLNHNSDRTARIISGANLFGHSTSKINTADNFLAPDSTAELFFAGEGSLNWGISAFYAGNNSRGQNGGTQIPASDQSSNESKTSLVGARLGVEAGNLQVFGLVGIAESAKISNANNDEIKGKLSWDLAATYKEESMTWIARTSHYGADVSVGGAAIGTTQNRNHSYGLGMGYKKDVSKTVAMFTRIEADYLQTSNDGGIAAFAQVNSTDKIWNLPLVLAAEAQALSWLTIRGSISDSLFGAEMWGAQRNNLQGTTTVSAGLGLTFGDVQIDGLVATGGSINPAVNGVNGTLTQPVPGMGTAPATNSRFGFGDNMLSRIAMTYNF